MLISNINVPYELAYFTGFAMGDGNYKSYDIDYKKQCDIDDSGRLYWRKGGNGIILYQKDILNSKIKQISDKLFNNPNYFKFNNTDDRRLAFSSADYNYLISKYFGFTYCENSFTKHLPENILDWDIESIESLIAGLIDSDGVVNPTKSEANIRLKSYAIITQLYDILLSMPNITAVVKNLIHDNKDNSNVGFGISFRVLPNSGIVDKSEKFYKNKNIPNYFEYDPQFCTSKRDNKIKKLIRFNRKDIHTKTGFYEAETEYVYDITTETGRFYANGMVQHNCWALDASKLVTIGREFGVLKSKPAKRVSSYISMLCETIHQMSNHLAGAIAIGSFFLDLAHLMIYKERRTLNELRTNKRIRKTIENEIQQFIHSINHLSRNGAESPFTNVSIFDRPKLEGLISDDNYGWYFPNHKAISTDNDLQDKMSNEDFKKYVIDYIAEIQNLFMDFFEKGDPLQNGMPYRFPVATINFSKVKNETTGKFEIQDKEFLKAVCKRDISRFNIFSSAGTKICSCCRLINDIEMLDFASQSNSLGGGGSISLGSHRVITINFQRIALECQSFEDYLNILSFRVEEAAKILKAHKLMLLKFTKEGYEPFIANGFINPKRLFSTFGLLGIYEANKTLRQRFDIPADRDITGEILEYFNTKVNDVSKQYGIIGNIEQIPGESFAVRLAEADKAIYGFGDDYYKLYANQFCPLYEDFTLAEKIKTDGKYNMKLTGGGIVHIQIATQTTPQQNEQLIKFACAEGCEHFALNRVYSRCKKCGKVYNTKVDKCDCGAEGDDLERLTRVIGFFTPVSSWGKVRREWEFPRRRFTDVSENQMK